MARPQASPDAAPWKANAISTTCAVKIPAVRALPDSRGKACGAPECSHLLGSSDLEKQARVHRAASPRQLRTNHHLAEHCAAHRTPAQQRGALTHMHRLHRFGHRQALAMQLVRDAICKAGKTSDWPCAATATDVIKITRHIRFRCEPLS